jgi:hypothetical protein
LPFDSAPTLGVSRSNAPAHGRAEKAITEFKAGHPYLLFHKRQLCRIRKRAIESKRLILRLRRSLCQNSHALSCQDLRASIKYKARRLINTAFMALICAGHDKHDALQTARNVLRDLCSKSSWNPRSPIKSFLDCAETAVAVSLAYDWLYDELLDKERQAVENALLRHVLKPALAAYEDPVLLWPKRRDNCTLVSNSSILFVSLAVIERYRPLATQLITKSLVASRNIFAVFAPDGAWPEGLSYWSLALRYASLMVAALESTLGDSFGLAEQPGFAQTGDFALHMAGPFGAAFNFGDSERQFDISPLAWLAYRFKRPIDQLLLQDYDGWYLPFMTIWGRSRQETSPTGLNLPEGKIFRGSNLACFRNTWSSAPKAHPVYLAIKGGNASGDGCASSHRPEDTLLHAQADAGSFIVDGARTRWVIDLGSDDYDLPGYFDHGADNRSGPRWRYYRTHAAGHNTLVIDGLNQVPDAHTPILGSCVEGKCKWVVFDLSAAYGKPACSVRRGVALVGRQILIQDEIDPDAVDDVVWAIHTSADPDLVTGSVARFRLAEDRFVARILEPGEACFELGMPPAPNSFPVVDTRQLHGRRSGGEGVRVSELPRRDDHEGKRAVGNLVRRLEVHWPRGAQCLTVLLLPDCDAEDKLLPVIPLNDWLARRSVDLTRSHPFFYQTKGRCGPEESSSTEFSALTPVILGKRAQPWVDHA